MRRWEGELGFLRMGGRVGFFEDGGRERVF